MTNCKFISKLLRLVGLRVHDFWFKHRLREFHLHVKPHKNGAQCPHCKRRGKIVRIMQVGRMFPLLSERNRVPYPWSCSGAHSLGGWLRAGDL